MAMAQMALLETKHSWSPCPLAGQAPKFAPYCQISLTDCRHACRRLERLEFHSESPGVIDLKSVVNRMATDHPIDPRCSTQPVAESSGAARATILLSERHWSSQPQSLFCDTGLS